jgi:hypothetical protein
LLLGALFARGAAPGHRRAPSIAATFTIHTREAEWTYRILATHTGSLIRPAQLLAFLAAKERGQDYDEEAYQGCLRESVDDVVRRQVEAGIDVVDDGEMGKASWITYLYERVSGLEVRPITHEGGTMLPPSRDRQAFPGPVRRARRDR